MKWKQKQRALALMAGLTFLMASCNVKQPQLRLEQVFPLDHFPSASAVEYYQNKLYLFGDDAPYCLVLDTDFRRQDSINFFKSPYPRLPKESKPDIESAAIVPYNGIPNLIAFGSCSAPLRNTAFAFLLSNPHNFRTLEMDQMIGAIQYLKDRNIEGAAYVKNFVVLANRANLSNAVNQLALIDIRQKRLGTAKTIAIRMQQNAGVMGVSGLFYAEKADKLFFTASTEATANAYDDGAIGASYIGWFNDFSKRIGLQIITPDAFINLEKIDKRFEKKKIEGLCVTGQKNNQYQMVLCADNDDGKSILYKISLQD